MAAARGAIALDEHFPGLCSRLSSYARRRGASADESEDIVQEALCRALEAGVLDLLRERERRLALRRGRQPRGRRLSEKETKPIADAAV